MKMATGLVAAALVIAIGIGSIPLFFNNNMKATQSADITAPAAPAAQPEYFDAGLAMNKAEAREVEMAAAEERGVAEDSVSMKFNETLMAKGIAPGQGLDGQAIESSRSGRMVIRTGNISLM